MKRLESVVNRMTSIAQLRNYSVLVVLFSFLTVLNLRAQTVVSTCSDDTIKLIAENYQYGALEWEKSVDSITWTRIENAHGTEYVFVPDESAYYRAVNKFSYCNPQYSTVFVVEKLPAAHAGSNRIVNATFVYLSGNFSRNSSCSWTVLEGSGGVFEQPNQPATKFTGVPADGTPDGPTGFYRLCYTLENSCGISRDTIEVNFVYNQYYDKLVIVDETDTIMSDSTQLVNGEYSIRFANPVPTIDDQTILIGISGDGFMQKVSSVTQSGNYFVMKTSQAKLEEILTKGGLELGQLYNFDPINETYRVKGYKRLNKVPTRAELLTEEKFKTGSHFFIVDEHMETDLDGVTISKVKRYDKIQRIKNENYDSQNNEDEFIAYSFDNTTLYDKNGIKANLDGVLEFVPNIVSDIKVNWLDFEDTNVNIGVDNAKVSFKSKLTVTSSGSYNSELDQITLGTVHKKMIVVVGGVPTLLQIKTQLKLATAFSATGNVTYVNEYEKTYKVSAGVKYEDNEWTNYFSENESSSMKHDLQVKGTLAPSFELGPIIYFTINGIAGPYVDTRLTTDLTLCASTQNLNDFNWQAEAMLGARLTLGIHGYMFKKKLFDFSKTWENRKLFHEVYPYTMEYVSGNNQQFSSTNSTLEQPFKVRVLSKLGVPAVGILVSFVPENNSGTLSNYQVFTDSEGYAQTYFTPAEPTVCKVKAYAKDCSFSNLNYSPVLFIASGFDCSKSTLSAHFLKKDNLITLVGTTGAVPYSYSTDGTNFSSTPPVIAVEAGKEYLAFVKDAKGCLALAYYKEREPGCDESTLQLNVEQSGRNVKAVALGGKAPYVYALNDQGYSAVSEFLNLANGTYAVKVKDGQGCERQVTITVLITSPVVGTVINPGTGRVWMDRNLGALRVATSSTDSEAYGSLYQWGRYSDEHEKRTSQTTTSLSSGDTPGHGKFIILNSGNYDWRNPQNNNLWQGVNGENNPCPEGFRIPTAYEWEAERTNWSNNNTIGAFTSPLKLPVAGLRLEKDGFISGSGLSGFYWSSTLSSTFAQYLFYTGGNAYIGSNGHRASGLSVRCIKDAIEITLPTLSTSTITSITNSSANSGGTIIFDGGATITSRGVVWSTSPNPTVSLSTKTTDGNGTGSFTSSIAGLNPTTTYYVRAYATNSTGTAYGNQLTFTTSSASAVNTVTSITGKIWMDRNLGASRVATSSTDVEAYGDLYQWGRGTDGHEKRNSQTTSTLSSSDAPGHGKFILSLNSPRDWRSPNNNNLWQGVNGVNNPCPEGFRMPTRTEWEVERKSWSSNNSAGAFTSSLKLPVAGRRFNGGSLGLDGYYGYYWSGTVYDNVTTAQGLYFSSSSADTLGYYRAYGYSVRCIKD